MGGGRHIVVGDIHDLRNVRRIHPSRLARIYSSRFGWRDWNHPKYQNPQVSLSEQIMSPSIVPSTDKLINDFITHLITHKNPNAILCNDYIQKKDALVKLFKDITLDRMSGGYAFRAFHIYFEQLIWVNGSWVRRLDSIHTGSFNPSSLDHLEPGSRQYHAEKRVRDAIDSWLTQLSLACCWDNMDDTARFMFYNYAVSLCRKVYLGADQNTASLAVGQYLDGVISSDGSPNPSGTTPCQVFRFIRTCSPLFFKQNGDVMNKPMQFPAESSAAGIIGNLFKRPRFTKVDHNVECKAIIELGRHIDQYTIERKCHLEPVHIGPMAVGYYRDGFTTEMINADLDKLIESKRVPVDGSGVEYINDVITEIQWLTSTPFDPAFTPDELEGIAWQMAQPDSGVDTDLNGKTTKAIIAERFEQVRVRHILELAVFKVTLDADIHLSSDTVSGIVDKLLVDWDVLSKADCFDSAVRAAIMSLVPTPTPATHHARVKDAAHRLGIELFEAQVAGTVLDLKGYPENEEVGIEGVEDEEDYVLGFDPTKVCVLSRAEGNHYEFFNSGDRYMVAREWGVSPMGNPFVGSWVIRHAEYGTYIDHDKYRTDLFERNNLKDKTEDN